MTLVRDLGRDARSQLPRTDDLRHPFRHVIDSPLRPLAQWVIRRRWDVEVVHGERVPGSGPVIIASNHIGIIDGPLLAIFAPRAVHVLTKAEMFAGRLAPLLRLVGQIPVERYAYDPAAVRLGLTVLRAGNVLGIYPEARRGGGDFDQFKHGAAYLALVTGAPVVPVTMLGSREHGAHTDAMPPSGAPVQLVFGEPFRVDPIPWPRTRDRVDAVSARLESHIRESLRAAQEETGRTLPGPLPRAEMERSA